MNNVNDYIFITNAIPAEVCEQLIDECNKKEWKKHTWNNYQTGESTSEETKEPGAENSDGSSDESYENASEPGLKSSL